MIRYAVVAGSVLLLAGCMSTQQQLGLSEQQWQSMSPPARQAALRNYQAIKSQPQVPQKVYDGPVLGIWMLDGYAYMPPFDQAYAFQATYFRIAPGQCQRVPLRGIDYNKSTKLSVCYDGLRLALDPSHYDLSRSHGTVYFDYNPVWKRGFTYANVSSSGYASLSRTSISIKALKSKDGST